MVSARCVVVAMGVAVLAGGSRGEVIVHLPFSWTITGGTRAQDYPAAQDALDIWAVEDFTTDRPWRLGTFSSEGTGYTGSPRPRGTPIAMDVRVRILDALPPEGRVIAQSVEGSGSCTAGVGPAGGELFAAEFAGDFLPPGSYYVMWQTTHPPSIAPTIMWATPGPYAVGIGTPDSSWRFRPNASPATVVIGTNIDGSGPPIGTNFELSGTPAGCPADVDADQGVTVDDLLLFLDSFGAGDPRADLDDGSQLGRPDQAVTVDDLVYFLLRFELGC